MKTASASSRCFISAKSDYKTLAMCKSDVYVAGLRKASNGRWDMAYENSKALAVT